MARKKSNKTVARKPTPFKVPAQQRRSVANTRILKTIITIAAGIVVLIFSFLVFNPSDLQTYTNISVVVLAAIASLLDLRTNEKKLTIWGWVFLMLTSLTVIGFSIQAFELAAPNTQVAGRHTKSMEHLPRRTDTIYKTTTKDLGQEPRPLIEVLGPAQLNRDDSTASFKVTLATIDDDAAIINSASATLFTTNMIRNNQKSDGFNIQVLENSIVSKALSLTFTQNAKISGAISDTVYSYLKVKFSNKNRKVQKPDFTRLYICVKNSAGTYDVFYMTNNVSQLALKYLKSQNKY